MISRRTLMQMMGTSAVALGTPFCKNRKAFAAREKEMNILCWEGYKSWPGYSIPSASRRMQR